MTDSTDDMEYRSAQLASYLDDVQQKKEKQAKERKLTSKVKSIIREEIKMETNTTITPATEQAPVILNLWQRISKIQSEVGNVPKNGYNTHFKYKYVLEADLTSALRDMCVKWGILITSSYSISEVKGDITYVLGEYTIRCIDTGESVVISVPGAGKDGQDKGPFKAITGSWKYALLRTFMIDTGDDPERDEAPHRGMDRDTAKQLNKYSNMTGPRVDPSEFTSKPMPPMVEALVDTSNTQSETVNVYRVSDKNQKAIEYFKSKTTYHAEFEGHEDVFVAPLGTKLSASCDKYLVTTVKIFK